MNNFNSKQYPIIQTNSEKFKTVALELLIAISEHSNSPKAISLLEEQYGGKNLYNMTAYLEHIGCFNTMKFKYTLTLSNNFYINILGGIEDNSYLTQKAKEIISQNSI